MAGISCFIRTDHVNKNNESKVVIQYHHLYKHWRIKNDLKVNVDCFHLTFEEETELWKFVASKTLKPDQRKQLVSLNASLRNIQDLLNKAVASLRLRGLPLEVHLVEKEYLKDPNAEFERGRRSVDDWYEKFIKAKEDEIGTGINSYKSTHEHFKNFISGRGAIAMHELTKSFFEDFRIFLKKKRLVGSTIHKQFKNIRNFLNWVQASEEDENDFNRRKCLAPIDGLMLKPDLEIQSDYLFNSSSSSSSWTCQRDQNWKEPGMALYLACP